MLHAALSLISLGQFFIFSHLSVMLTQTPSLQVNVSSRQVENITLDVKFVLRGSQSSSLSIFICCLPSKKVPLGESTQALLTSMV